MACDFSRYNELRDFTRNKAASAQAACSAVDTAQSALEDANAAYDAALTAKDEAYAEWESAEQAENAEAMRLGINPVDVPPTNLPSRAGR